jgi:hypothetical protein
MNHTGIACAAILTAVTAMLAPSARVDARPQGATTTRATRGKAEKPKAPRKARVPAELVGTWTWGGVNPGRYVSKTTGEYVGHAGGGAISYTFGADGTHHRYVLIHFGAGFSNESIFSSMDGTADCDEAAGTFTIRFTRGNITFEKKSGMQKRPLSREDMERGGTEFTYRLQKDEDGKTVLFVNDKGKPATEGKRFYREANPAAALQD